VVVRLKAEGLSLLTASVTVYDSLGRVVGSAKSIDPTNNDLTVTFRPGLLGGTYYVKVEGARNDAFDVGAYKLGVDFLSLGSVLAPITNGLLGGLLGVQNNTAGTDARFDAVATGSLSSASEVDTYHVSTNKFAAGTPVTLDLMVWGLDANPVDARVRVFDSSGKPVAFQVLANDRGIFSVQVLNAVAGKSYTVQVSARDGAVKSTGNYFFAADFNQLSPMAFDGVASDTLPAGATTAASGTLTLGEAGLFQFAFGANSSHAGDAVTMTVYDENGNAVFSLTATAGRPPVTAGKYLMAGNYTVKYTTAQATAAPTSYNLFMMQLSDPVGPYATSTASPSSSTAPSSTSSTAMTAPPPQDSTTSTSSGSTTTTSSTSSGSTTTSAPPPSSSTTQESSYYYSGSSTTQPSGYYYTY
jgi:hypothetical protein